MKKLFSLLTLALLTMSAWAANTYVKVTSADQLVAGQKYIVVNEEYNYAMGAINSGNTKFGLAISVAVSNGVVDIDGKAVVELTLGGSTGAWTFDMGNGAYLFWSSGNSLNTNSDATSTGAQWTATLTNGAIILANNAGTSEGRVLQFNATSGQERFACYKGTQKDAVLYVQDAGTTPPVTVAAPTLPAACEFEGSYTVNITNNEEGATVYYSIDNKNSWVEGTSVTITETTKVFAKAEKDGVTSNIVNETYTKVVPAIEPIGNTYQLVTDVTKLAAGDQIILVNKGVAGEAKAMGDQNSNGNNFLSTDVTIDNNLKITTETAQILVLETKDSNWYLKTLNHKYLYAASSSSNNLKLENAPDENRNAEASISIADSAIVVFQGSSTHNILRYNENNGSPLFSCYLPDKMAPIYIFKSTGEEEEYVADPVLPASQDFEESMIVTITAEEGATIMYSFDNENWNTYSEPLTITETTTVYAKALKGNAVSNVVSATYTLKVTGLTVANIAEGIALNDNSEFTFTGNAVVCHKYNKNLWIRDESGSVMVYNSSANFGDEFVKGVVITPNWGAKKTTYNNMPEFTNLTNFTASNQTVTVEPFERTTLGEENANEYVVLKNVTIDTTYTSGGKTNYITNTGVNVRNNYNVSFDPQDGVAYNIIGIVTYYSQGGYYQLYITEVEGYVAPVATPNDLAAANALTDNMPFTYQNDVAATYQHGKYLFLRDEAGNSGMIYGSVDATFETGDVLGADWTATKTTFHGAPQFANPNGVTNSGVTWTVEPNEHETLTADNVHEYVIVKGQTITACTDTTNQYMAKTFYNGDGMVLFNQFDVDMSGIEEGKTYDVVGIANLRDGEVQMYIISVTEATAAGMRGDVDNSGNVDISDATALINYLLYGNSEGLNMDNANCDLTGGIDISDATTLINYLLYGTW